MAEEVQANQLRDKHDQSDLERKLREEGWPMLLRKATRSPLPFHALLQGFEQPIAFNTAESCGTGWARLRLLDNSDARFPHGVEVRLDRIVWLAED